MNPSRTFSHHYNLPPHLQYQLYLFLKSSKTLPNDHLIKWYQFLKKEDNYYFPSLMNITYDPNDNIPRIDYEIIKNMFLFYKNKYLTIQNIHTTVAGTTTLPGQMLTKDGTHTHSLSSILSILWNINLELLLMKLSQNNKMKKIKFPPLKQQFELSLLWRTISLFLESDDLHDILEFFEEFSPILISLPPLSLSTYWNKEGNSYVGLDEVTESLSDMRLLPIPEISYLQHPTDKFDPSLVEFEIHRNHHDPLGIVQKLFDLADNLCQIPTIPLASRASLLKTAFLLAVKSGRASLIQSCCNTLSKFDSLLFFSYEMKDLLNELFTFVKQLPPQLPPAPSPFPADALFRSYSSTKGGMILSFGKADHGKLGHGDSQVHRSIPTVIESMKDCQVTKVASMSTYSVVVDSEGSVYVWGTGGSTSSMQGLRTDILPQPLEALAEKSPVKDVACGLGHALFLLSNGRICSWGNGGNGRLGLGDTTDRAEACLIKELVHEYVESVYCGASHSMAVIRRTGRVYTWGKNSQGQCGRGSLEDVLKPTLNITLKNEVVVKLAAGWEHSLALTATGKVYAWGSGYKDSRRGLVPPALGLGHSDGRTLPELITSLEGLQIIDIASGWDHCLALDSKRRVLSWGSGQNGKLGHGSEENISSPCIIPTLENIRVQSISAGSDHSAVITEDGKLYTWGHGDGGRLGHGDNEPRTIPTLVTALEKMHTRPIVVSCGDKFTMIIVEPQLLPENESPETRPQSSVVSIHNYVDDCFTNESATLAGCDVLLCFLSLMARSFRPNSTANPQQLTSPKYAFEYSVEVSTLTFESLYSLLDIHTNSLFENQEQDSEASTTPPKPAWNIVRVILHLLSINLRTLFELVNAEFPLPSPSGSDNIEPIDALLRTLNDPASNDLVQPLHTVTSADRLASLLSTTGNDCDARSSDDEEDDDDEEEEDEDDDDDEDESEEDEDEDDDEYDHYAGQLDGDLDDPRGDDDQLDEFEIGKSAYTDDDGAEDDLGLNTPGAINYHDISPRQGSLEEKLAPVGFQGNNESDNDEQYSPTKLDSIFHINSNLGLSPGVGSDDDVEDLIRVDGHHSPALSNTSVDLSHHLVEYDSSAGLISTATDKLDSLKTTGDDNESPNQFQICDNEEDDEDLQKAIYSSMNRTEKDDRSVGQVLFQREFTTTSRDILSVLSGRLEDISRKYFDEMHVYLDKKRWNYVELCFDVWEEIQEAIGRGFLIMYPFVDQKEIIISLVRDPIDILHMIPGISSGLQNDRLVFLIQDILDTQPSPRNDENLSSPPSSLSFINIVHVLQKLKTYKYHFGQISQEFIQNSLKMKQRILSSLYDIYQSIVYQMFLKKLTDNNHHEDIVSSMTINEFSTFYRLLLDIVEEELKEIISFLLSLHGDVPVTTLELLLQTTVISSIFSCIGSIQTNTNYFQLELASLFLSSALRYLSHFQSFSSSCDTLPLPIREPVLKWIHQETKWVLLYLSSMIGVCIRSGSESDLLEEKYRTCSSYQSCSQSLFNASELYSQSSKTILTHIPASLKSWKWIFETNTVFHGYLETQHARDSACAGSYPEHWKLLIEILSKEIVGDSLHWDYSEIEWFYNLENSVYSHLMEYLHGNLTPMIDLLQVDGIYLQILGSRDTSRTSVASSSFLPEIHQKEFFSLLIVFKLCVFAITLTISGSMPTPQTPTLTSKIVDSWIAMVMIVSSFLKSIHHLPVAHAHEDRIHLNHLQKATHRAISILQSPINTLNIEQYFLPNSENFSFASYFTQQETFLDLQKKFQSLQDAISSHALRPPSPIYDMTFHPLNIINHKDSSSQSNPWYSTLVDLGILLLGSIEISHLHEIALIRYLSLNCITSAMKLIQEILHRLHLSIFGLSYFIKGLILPHISGLYSSPSLLIRSSEFMTYEDQRSSSSPSAINSSELLSPIRLLDQQMISILSSSNLDKSSLCTVASQLIDSLKLSVCLPFFTLLQSNLASIIQSPISGIHLFAGVFHELLHDQDISRRNFVFWKNLNSLFEFFSSLQPLELTSSSSQGFLELNLLQNLYFLLDCLTHTICGLGNMKLTLIRDFESNESKFLFSQIRSLNFSSPIVIPNASTNTGEFSIGIWLKIPLAYYELICKFENSMESYQSQSPGMNSTTNESTNQHTFPSNSIKIHILSRVPEAGDIDMTSLFQDRPVTPSTTGIVLVSFPDGTTKLIVTFTVFTQSSTHIKKSIRLVKLLSKSLPSNEWLDIVVKYEPLPALETNPSTFEKGERARVTLSINGEVHATTEDYFGRISLHQNIVFGTTPISLIKPLNDHLLAGGLRWTTRPSSGQILTTQEHFLVFSNGEKVQIPWLPLTNLHERLMEASNTYAYCATATSSYLKGISLRIKNEKNFIKNRASLETLNSFLSLMPALGDVGLRVLGICTSEVDEASFDLFNAAVSFLEGIQSVTIDYTSTDHHLGTQLYNQYRQVLDHYKRIFVYLLLVVRVLLDPRFPSGNELDQIPLEHRKLLLQFVDHRAISQNKIYQGDFGLQYSTNFEGSLSKQIENSLISNISSLFTRIFHSKLLQFHEIFSASKLSMELAYLIFVAGGGWPVALRIGSLVDLFPRALFLNNDPKSIEQVIFSSSATVHTLSSGLYGRPCGVWVNRCSGGYVRFSLDRDQHPHRDDNPPTNVTIPRSERSLLPVTEMLSPRDNHIPLDFPDLSHVFNDFPVRTAENLSNLLKSAAASGFDNIDSFKAHQTGDHPALVLAVCMSQMRCLLVQLTTLDALTGEKKLTLAKNLATILSRDLSNILSIASIDPVATVVEVFKAKMSSTGLNSTGQLDVLSNLLREGDLIFLERISLRIWRHFQPKSSSSKSEMGPGPSALAGEVQIAGNRIRALSHFPSVRILPIHLERMTGRWFYECTLLTDGLMQIGWADKSFRCDPVCGQGVGDHLHSWAIDGLRTKKWNVSCDSYGLRWKVEDIVGVLVDMDLLEMKFFLNGVDLGTAFVNFSSNGLYPALSLNVRQSLRVNYGQERFIYPPTVVDGLPFRPVIDAVKLVKEPEKSKLSPAPSPSNVDTKFEDLKNDIPSAVVNSSLFSTEALAEQHGGGGSRVGVRIGRAEIPVDEDRNALERVVTTVSDTDDEALAIAASRRAAGEEGEGNEVWREMSRRAMRRGSRGNSAPGTRSATQQTSAAMFLTPSAPNLEGSDGTENVTKDETEGNVGTGETNGMADNNSIFSHHLASSNTTTPELEARRQLLIENLIGMGFPVDWALRASEQCDASVSESSAIAWIIERMELEQAKLEELEGGDSRIVDEEEFGDGEDTSMDPIRRRGYPFDELKEGNTEDLMSRANQPGSNLSGGQGMKMNLGMSSNTKPGNLDVSSFQDQGTWNSDDQRYASILVGQQSARRRFDMDKQAVLCQISELDFSDLYPIVLSCEFSLAIFYARAIFVRILRQICLLFDQPVAVDNPCEFSNMFLKVLFASQDGIDPQVMIRLLSLCFRQGQSPSTHPERLFPSLLHGTVAGDPIDSTPSILPFTHPKILSFTSYLSKLEMCVFGNYIGNSRVPKSIGSLSPDEASLQSSNAVIDFTKVLTMASDLTSLIGSEIDYTPYERSISRNTLFEMIEECVSTFEKATHDVYDRRDWISAGSERSFGDNDPPRTQDFMKHPPVLWAYTTLKNILQTCRESPSSTQLSRQSDLFQDLFVTSDTVYRLLKAVNQSPNTSLAFCVYDICKEILASVNSKIIGLEKLLGDTNQSSQVENELGLAQYAQMELREASSYYAAFTSNISSSLTFSGTTLSVEFRLLRNLASRLMTESNHYRQHSKLTRVISELLLEILNLRRSLTGITQDSSCIHSEIIEDWKWIKTTFSRTTTPSGKSIRHEGENHSDVEKPQPTFIVTQISSNSITISWSGLPESDDWNNQHSKSSTTSHGRIAASVGGLLASIKGSTPQALHTSYSLYITPLSGSQQTLPLEQRSRSLLVLPYVSPRGSQKIDLLDPDTLYKISLISDEERHSAGSEDKSDDKKSPFSWNLKTLERSKSITESFFSSSDGSIHDAHETKEQEVRHPPEEISIMVSTCGEALFLLDSSAATRPPQLQVSNHGLTVRNTLNKKWSTIRSTVRLSSGVHRWDVVIDRCISKNIFIGVVGPDARSDNYVGFDKYGWGFLANRAVWNDKQKMKSYGDLFRTGDIVSVTLDLDQGILAFAINGKDLGVAVDGLVGPLYPAFSLYNEDDQLSLSPPRQPTLETDLVGGSRWGTGSAERVMQRLHTLHTLLLMLQTPWVEEDSFNPQLVSEFCRRWALWRNEIGLRTVRVDGDLVVLLVSPVVCLAFSDNRYSSGDLLQWENTQLMVIGVGRHRLWLQKISNGLLPQTVLSSCIVGDMVGFTRDTLQQLNSKNALRLLKKTNLFKTTIKLSSTDFKASKSLNSSSTNLNALLFSEDELDHEDYMRRVLQSEGRKWTLEDDQALIQWLELRARVLGTHPLNLKKTDVSSPTTILDHLKARQQSRSGKRTDQAIVNFCQQFSPLMNRSESSIQLRSMILIHFNDLLQPLLPLIYHGNSHEERDLYALSSLISWNRSRIFLEVKFGFGFRLGWSSPVGFGSQLNPSRGNSAKNETLKADLPIGSKVVFSTTPCELPILPQKPFPSKSPSSSLGTFEKEVTLKRQSLGADITSSQYEDYSCCFPNWSSPISNIMVAVSLDVSIIPPQTFLAPMMKRARLGCKEQTLIDDLRWRLLAGYQSSFLGQLIQSFECSNQRQMQGIIASISATSDSLKRTDGPWDAILRSVCRGGSFWEDVIPPKNRPVPLHIYSYHTQELDNPDTNSMKRRLNRVLSLSHQANIAMMIADEDTTSTVLPASVISQWTLLQVFVLDAMKDIQSLLDSRLFFPSSKEDEISILFDKATREDQPQLPGIVNILLNLMHSAGIVLGLCLRAGTIANITLPDYFWKIFCNEPHEIVSAVTATEEEEENPLKRNFLLCCGLAMRHGMTSCLPESYLDILTPCDLKTLLNGGGTLNVENLRLFASYCSPVCENDDSVEVFWLALSDLPRLSLFKFLQYLWSCDENNSIEHLSDELYYWRNSNLPLGQIRIGYSDYQEEDSATTTSEPSHSGIMIPEYGVILLPRNVTTYVAMSTHVKILIDAL